jgi:hypothetical protein
MIHPLGTVAAFDQSLARNEILLSGFNKHLLLLIYNYIHSIRIPDPHTNTTHYEVRYVGQALSFETPPILNFEILWDMDDGPPSFSIPYASKSTLSK